MIDKITTNIRQIITLTNIKIQVNKFLEKYKLRNIQSRYRKRPISLFLKPISLKESKSIISIQKEKEKKTLKFHL